MIELNQKINNFTLKNDKNEDVSLYDIKNDYIVLYFYPKDDTPGCTIEANLYKEYYEKLKEENVTVLGISKDSVDSHVKFKCKYELPFTLLSDPDLEVLKYFGAYGEKNMYGKITMGVIRKTFVLDKDYKVIKIYERAIAKDNAKKVYDFIQSYK